MYFSDSDRAMDLMLDGSAAGGHLDRFKFIFCKGGTDIDQSLACAVANSRMNIIEYMIDRGMRIVEGDMGNERRPITWSLVLAKSGGEDNLELIDLCIAKGAKNLDEALMEACIKGNIEAAQYLIDKGATGLEQALYDCCDLRLLQDNQSMMGLLQSLLGEMGPQMSGLMDSLNQNIHEGAGKGIEYLCENGVNVNTDNSACIFRACKLGSVKNVLCMLYYGSSIKANGRTLKPGSENMKELLVDYFKGKMWAPERHSQFPESFQKAVIMFLISVKKHLEGRKISQVVLQAIVAKMCNAAMRHNISVQKKKGPKTVHLKISKKPYEMAEESGFGGLLGAGLFGGMFGGL